MSPVNRKVQILFPLPLSSWKQSDKGHAQCVELFLETSGADINECGRNGPALCEAICKEHTGIIDLLILSGADVNKASFDGETPLMIAAQKGNENIVKTMIRAGADVNLARSDGPDDSYDSCL